MSLPGVNTVIKDRFIALSRTDIPLGPRVGIIGMRDTDDGSGGVANLDPYTALNEDDVITAFGDGSHLHRGYLEAMAGGATRVTLIALPSDTTYNHTTATISSTTYTALVGSNTLFDDAFAAAEAARVDIVVPWGRGSGPTEFESPATPGNDAELGFYADNSGNPANSWAAKIAQKCYDITANSYPCFAVLGISPYIGTATADGGMTPAAANTHLQLANIVDHETTSLKSIGPYVSVVATEMAPLGYNNSEHEWGYSNGAAIYAGYICGLDSWSAPTGKLIFNVDKIRYNPTNVQQQSLIDAGVVPVALNMNRQPTWVDARTFATDTSDYVRLTTLRIVFDTVQMVKGVAQQFIGEASNTQTKNALDTAITSGLRAMMVAGALQDSDFNIVYDPTQYKAIVDVVLRPAFELRNIEVRVSINL